MTNELSPDDVARILANEVDRRMTEAEEAQRKATGQLTREELNGMSWQDINRARAEGRLNTIMLGGE